MENMNELFAAPVNNELVATIDGTKLYTNPKLKEKYIEAMSKTSPTRKIDNISELVEKEKVVPCWLNKNILHYIAYKVFAPSFVKGIAGFYDNDSNKIFLLIDNNVTFGHASNSFLSILTVHEGTHMFAHNNTRKFLSLFSDELKNWYFHFFFNYLDLKVKYDVKDFPLDNLVKYMFNNMEYNIRKGIDKKTMEGFTNRIYKMFKDASNFDEEKLTSKLEEMLTFIRIFQTNPDMLMTVYKRYKNLTDSMYEAYKQAFGIRNMTTLCVQELLYPSEVVSIYVERIESSKIKTMFRSL